MVGSMLFMVGGLMLGQRVSNEQSNVVPTKYVAVGPTLNQRLGFGWRMVCWALPVTSSYVKKLEVTEMKMCIWTCGHTLYETM